MKKYILLLLIPLLLTCCNKSTSYYTIGVSQCSSGKWREKVNHEMLSAQHLYDKEVKISIANCYDNAQKQVQQIDSLIDANVDLLVIAPYEYSHITKSIERARQKNIPVVLFDRKISPKNYTAYIGGDNVEAGACIGRYALQLADRLQSQNKGRKTSVLELTGPMEMSPARERHKGFAQTITPNTLIDYQFLITNWTPEDNYKRMKAYLKAGKRPDIVFCHSDIDALGAYQAAKECGLEKSISFLGIDGLPGKGQGLEGVKSGKLAGTYIYPTHGEEIILLALNILEGKKYKQNNTIQSFVVTPTNVDDIMISTQVMMQQNDYLITIQNKLENYLGQYHTQQMVLYFLAFAFLISLVAILLIGRAIQSTRRANHQMKKANNKMKKLNEEQTLFYTNASHQLKTPLTLIAGPAKELLANCSQKKDRDKELLEILNRNVNLLEQVVYHVLNFKEQVKKAMAEDTLLSVSDDAIPNSQLLADEQHEDKSVTNDIQKGHQKMLLKLDTDELPTILVVDENSDMRKFLHTLFADNYYVIEAADGQSGLKLAREGVPDLIVSDIIMPVMNGLEFCQRIKEDPITSHIPVLLLSAQSTDHQLIEGFKNGAEAYITKPFNAQLLISHIESLLYNREKLRQQFAKSANVNLSTTPHHKDDAQKKEANEHKQEIPAVQMSTADRRFIDNLKTAILEKMADSHLKMEDLGDELGLSRVQLYRKVKALTGLTPVELLRKMRLQQAYALLLNSDKSVSEICYEVGFGTPSYFASCFKKEFDIYPADLKKNNN